MIRAGIFLIFFSVLVALIGGFVAPYDFDSLRSGDSVFGILSSPNQLNWFGTTSLGMDVFSRTVLGAQTSVIVLFVSVSASLILGLVLALLFSFFSRWIEGVLLFLTDVLLSIPPILIGIVLALAISAGTSSFTGALVATAVSEMIVFGAKYFRVLRISLIEVRQKRFVEAAQVLGLSKFRVFVKHELPNALGALPVLIAQNAGSAISTLAGLGFLGVGVQANTGAEWGYDLSRSLSDLQGGIWWTALYPGIFLTVLIVGFGLVSEGLSKRGSDAS